VYSKEELIFFMRSLQLENKKISLSLQEQRSVLNDIYEDLGTSHGNLNDRMDHLAKAVGGGVTQMTVHPRILFSLVCWALG
jgi:hypothetical protein